MRQNIRLMNRYQIRIPYLTIGLSLVLIVMYLFESHPHPNIQIGFGWYMISAFSNYTFFQLATEIAILFIGGFPAEQLTKRWILLLFVLFLAPSTIWLAEVTHPNTLVLGLSGASLGLIGFSTLGGLWFVFQRPKSELLFILFSLFALGGVIEIMTSMYGYFLHVPIFPPSSMIHIYKSNTMYVAHVTGAIIGGGWWIIGHYLNGVQ